MGVGGVGGVAGRTQGNIKSDSAPHALIRKTIRNEQKSVFNARPLFLSPQTCFCSLLDAAAAAAAVAKAACTDAGARMRKALAILECLRSAVGV